MQRLCIVFILFFSLPITASAQWRYTSGKDKLNDEEYSYTYAYTPDYQYNNDFSIGFRCQNARVRFEIDVDTLINSKGDPFEFSYRVDKKQAQTIKMNTYSNDGQGGYSYPKTKLVAKEILGGNKIFVRAVTWNNDWLQTTISLAGSDRNIKKVFADCGQSLTDSDHVYKNDYTFSNFRSDFQKLSVKRQKEILQILKKEIGK